MQSMDLSDLDRLERRLKQTIEKIPEGKRKLHNQLGSEMKRTVRSEVAASTNDVRGHLQSYQTSYIGSAGGYAAVRAVDWASGANSPGAITNYTNSGHKIRRPSGKSKRYYARIQVSYVNGRHYYEAAKKDAENAVRRAAERFVKEVADQLGGNE